MLSRLLDSLKERDGEERLEEIKRTFKGEAREALNRELILQIVSKERWWNRVKFLTLYPELIVPYLVRIKTCH